VVNASYGRSLAERFANGELKSFVVAAFDQGDHIDSLEYVEKNVCITSVTILLAFPLRALLCEVTIGTLDMLLSTISCMTSMTDVSIDTVQRLSKEPRCKDLRGLRSFVVSPTLTATNFRIRY